MTASERSPSIHLGNLARADGAPAYAYGRQKTTS
jgi:hypothetical protein